MGIKSKVKALEDHVLPEQPQPARFYIGDPAEIALSEHAEKIKRKYWEQAQSIISNPDTTYDQKKQQAQQFYESIPPYERLIIDKENDFNLRRIVDLLTTVYEESFPKTSRDTLKSRIYWFLLELDKLTDAENIIDTEWNFNRNEESPDFDDNLWWEKLDKKIAKLYPEGIFTKESFEAFEQHIDELQSAAIREYWKENPEELKRFNEEFEAKMKQLKKRMGDSS